MSILDKVFKSKDIDKDKLREEVIAQLKTIYDPEIPVNIYALGLIYEVFVDEDANVVIQMTLTTPGCPVAQTFPTTIETTVNNLASVNSTAVQVVWEPPWTTSMMDEEARVTLGMF